MKVLIEPFTFRRLRNASGNASREITPLILTNSSARQETWSTFYFQLRSANGKNYGTHNGDR